MLWTVTSSPGDTGNLEPQPRPNPLASLNPEQTVADKRNRMAPTLLDKNLLKHCDRPPAAWSRTPSSPVRDHRGALQRVGNDVTYFFLYLDSLPISINSKATHRPSAGPATGRGGRTAGTARSSDASMSSGVGPGCQAGFVIAIVPPGAAPVCSPIFDGREAVGELPHQTGDGLFSIMLRPCTAEVLGHLLDPKVPFVWVVGHYPNKHLEWWRCHLPLSRSGAASAFEVRGLNIDVLLPTSEFLTRLSDFDGLVMQQMRRKVPNTLTIEGLDERNRTRILIQNGLAASFYLPHAMECASFKTVERSAIEKVLSNDVIRTLAF
jgi:hypothetical protein